MIVLIDSVLTEDIHPISSLPHCKRVCVRIIVKLLPIHPPVVACRIDHIPPLCYLGGIHDVYTVGYTRNASLCIELDVECTDLLLLFLGRSCGSDEYHTVCTPGTVNGCRRHILEHGYGHDVCRVDFREVLDHIHHAVQNDQRLISSRNGTRTTYLDSTCLSRSSGLRRELGTGDASLKRLRHIGSCCRLQVTHFHYSHTSRQVALLGSTVADHHHIIEGARLRLELHGNVLTGIHSFYLGFISDERDLKKCIRRHLKSEFSVYICDSSLRGIVLIEDPGPDQRLPVLIKNLSRHSYILRNKCPAA